MLNLEWKNLWSEEELYKLQVDCVDRFMRCNTRHAVEATVEFASFLNEKGLDADNYPLFLELLRNENYHVVDALLGKEDPFEYFSVVEPNYYIVDFCFRMLYQYSPGGVHAKTLALIFGVLYRCYHSSKEGFALHPLSIENLNSIGKFLDKSKDQNDQINRFILDILSDIAEYYTHSEDDEEVNKISAHAVAIRNAFYDRRKEMNQVMPEEILQRKNYMETSISPREKKKKPAAKD
jgi:hypothetical protein